MPKKEAKPSQATAAEEKKTCGLIMPISARDGLPEAHWSEVRSIVGKSLASLDLDVRLVSDGEASDVIHKTILQRLYTSTVCVCDISTLNPNVMFELGIRLSFSKPTVIIGDDATALPFDAGLIRRLPYPRDLRYQKIQRFMTALRKAATSALEAAAKGDESNSLMSVLGPIKVPQLETQEVPGLQLVVDELRDVKSMLSRQVVSKHDVQAAGKYVSTRDILEAVRPIFDEGGGEFRKKALVMIGHSREAINKLDSFAIDLSRQLFDGRHVRQDAIRWALGLFCESNDSETSARSV